MEEDNEHYADQGFPAAGPEPGEALASAPSWPPQEQAPAQPAATATAEGAPPSDDAGSPAFMPRRPRKLADVGLSRAFLTDLALKTIHYSGTPSLTHLTETMALSSNTVKELISAIVDERLCEVVSSSSVMTGSYRYRLTPTGLERVKDALERSRYAGPAPVTVQQYIEVAKQQRLATTQPSRRSIEAAVSELVLSPEVADSLARALHSGRCTLIYGPSGNGKTLALEAFARHLEGTVLVPYAIYAQGQTIRVFDSSIHIPVQETREPSPVSANDDESRNGAPRDRRWALIRRPAIILGGELSKEALELAFDPVSRFHQAPPHVKAQGGVLVVDDFGRQRMRAEDLLNRWLEPLERGWDTLTFQTGEKLSLPIDVHLLFATNLNVELLLDQPFLRRIRYKVELPNPRREDFREILARACEEHGIEPTDEALDHVVERMYQDGAHMPRASYARDLLDIMVASARYDETEPVLTPETFERAYRLFIPSPEHKASKPAP